jgi:hypothetical protein
MPLKTNIAVNAEPTIALSRGIEVSIDITKNVIAPAARLSGSQVLIADEDLITPFLMLFSSQFIGLDSLYVYGVACTKTA